ncbi:ABC transporter permease [Microbacterium sediminis]|uniref:Sodium ABC transporter permease n=1 Tax=Microbacterium sediminis TaxID=904291 RepID=A0A1B9N9Q2_9MICO|nr:ABC transporter permease [Microbacterium sediminis]OCG73338.1 sodium ABC transporter permease [Microbacterium sediminis]QBR75238.1 ABC transporter permease [Microbacterium sediminis]
MNAAPAPLTAAQGTWLVAERDIMGRLRSKSFLISTLITLLIAVGGIVVMGIISSTGGGTPVAATADAAALLPDTEALEVTQVADRAEGEQLVRDGDVDALVMAATDSPTGVEIVALTEPPSDVVALLSVAPEVTLLEDPGVPYGLRYVLGMIFGIAFMGTALSFAMPISTAVVEEKQTRVIEILISTIPARVLLAGKVLGNLVLAMGQILLIIAAATIALAVTGQSDILRDVGAPMAWFAVFFLFGFPLLSAMFAAAGAMVSRQEDISPTVMPIMYLVMIPYFLAVFLGGNPIVMTIMSYVPFSAPVAMPIRLYFDEALWWEPIISLVIMAATAVAIVLLGARIYENSLLRMGGRVKLAEALKA